MDTIPTTYSRRRGFDSLTKVRLLNFLDEYCVRGETLQCSSKQFNARVAQLVEHLVEAQGVGGSSPSPCTSFETVDDNCNCQIQVVRCMGWHRGPEYVEEKFADLVFC